MERFSFRERPYDMPPAPIDPVVRVLCRMDRGEKMMVSRGSGFFVDEWLRTIVTAGHVVRAQAGAQPVEIAVDVAPNEGPPVRLWACSVAYPDGGVPDVAVVCFSKTRPPLIESTEMEDPPAGQFQATLHGYDAEGQRRRIDVSAVQGADLIRLIEGSGVHGMSGGPLGLPRIYGAYLGQPPGVDFYAALDPDSGVLNQCMDAARSICNSS